jgi:Cu/Ag efflux pump CusA
VVVWGKPEIRNSLTNIQNLLIDRPGGGHVRLGEVAEVRIAPAPTVIKHEAVRSYLDIGINVSGRGLDAVAADIEERLQDVKFPMEYYAEVSGGQAGRQADLQRLLGTVVAAVIGIFLLLQAAYASWRLAFVTLLTLPMALAGGVLAVLLGGGILSLGSMVGLLAVLGIAVRNGMVMTSHFQHLEQHEGEHFGPELVLRGASERLAPILMTALTVALAFLPNVLLGDIPGHEIIRPMALVILGGLVTATLLNLFVVPALYLRFGASPSTASLPSTPPTELELAQA